MTPRPDSILLDDATRLHTLEETGVFLYRLGLAVRPVPTSTVYEIERRAVDKLRRALRCRYRTR